MLDEEILAIIVSKLEATAAANRAMSKSTQELKEAMIRLNENQMTLHKASEDILLAAHKAEDRAARAEKSWARTEAKIDNFSHDVQANNKAFVESIANFNQLQIEWKARSKDWDYRIENIEQVSLQALHKRVESAVDDVDKQVCLLREEIAKTYLSIEQYRDDQQDEAIAIRQKKIEEYEGIFEQIKALIKRGGGWAYGAIGAAVILVKDQVPWGEIWGWFVDNFFN